MGETYLSWFSHCWSTWCTS